MKFCIDNDIEKIYNNTKNLLISLVIKNFNYWGKWFWENILLKYF